MARSGMRREANPLGNPKTLQYLMGHIEIGVTMNTYTHLGLEDAVDELKKLEEERQYALICPITALLHFQTILMYF